MALPRATLRSPRASLRARGPPWPVLKPQLGSFLMGWMPPPDGIAMCQDGDVEVTNEGEDIRDRDYNDWN